MAGATLYNVTMFSEVRWQARTADQAAPNDATKATDGVSTTAAQADDTKDAESVVIKETAGLAVPNNATDTANAVTTSAVQADATKAAVSDIKETAVALLKNATKAAEWAITAAQADATKAAKMDVTMVTADYAVPNDATEVMDGVTTKEPAVKAVNEAAANAAVVSTAVESRPGNSAFCFLQPSCSVK